MDGSNSPIRLVAFDLDGTLLRGDTVCEAIARRLGHLSRMQELERLTKPEDIKAAREEMAKWYGSSSLSELCSYLGSLQLAPGAYEGFRRLKQHEVKIAIVSITWDFAVQWFAKHLGADYYVGTGLSPDARITHFWPGDKLRWLLDLIERLSLDHDDVAAVGDSKDDIEMLLGVGHRFFVGPTKPKGLDSVSHHPEGNIFHIAKLIVG